MRILLAFCLLAYFSFSEAGVSFIRWGRTKCPAGTHTLYKGYMAGSHWAVGGSGSNYLCMNDNPQFVRGKPGVQGRAGMIYGVEIEYVAHWKNQGLFLLDNIPDGELHNKDIPCVTCYVAGSTDLLLMPGRQDCGESGYDLQYKGFLVSDWHNGHGKGQYVCMDEAPEARAGGVENNDQAVIYPVEIGCGSLPCNPFVDGMEATCAVCTY